jgi:hypothetical protein
VNQNADNSYLTNERLKSYLDTNQYSQESMCTRLLAIDGRFTNVKPRQPRGGADGGRDIEATFQDTLSVFGAVGFVNQATDKSDDRIKSESKFIKDIDRAISEGIQFSMFIFFTNVSLTVRSKEKLISYAKEKAIHHCEIYDRERITLSLNSADGYAIRYEFLNISLSEAEQATFFAKWGEDIQGIISDGFGKLQKSINRLLFLHEVARPISTFSIIIKLNSNECLNTDSELSVFCDLKFSRPKRVINKSETDAQGIVFGLEATKGSSKLTGESGYITINPESVSEIDYKQFQYTSRIRPQKIKQIPLTFSFDPILSPSNAASLHLKDLDESYFVINMNKFLFDKIKSIHVYGNEYEIVQYTKENLRSTNCVEDTFYGLEPSKVKDDWIIIRPSENSYFEISFSRKTPKRLFEPIEA